MELVVVLAVTAMLAAVLAPQVMGRLRGSEVTSLARNLQTVAGAIEQFRADVGRYPDSVQHLVSLPAGRRDACGYLLPGAFSRAWAGPYLSRRVADTGIVSNSSTILLDIGRSPALSSPADPLGTLIITAEGVDRATAEGLEAAFDGSYDPSGGTVRWIASASADRGTLYYDIPIRGC